MPLEKREPPQGEAIRLTNDAYKQLEDKFKHTFGVHRDTTDLQVAYANGIQAVLRELREGFVIGR